MSQQIEIEVIDKDGWKKTFPVEKNIFHIGSIAANEIVLEPQRGAGVSPRHAQLIALQGGGFRLVNLGDGDIHVSAHGENDGAPHTVVAPRAVASVTGGSILKIGDFTLTFRSEASPTSGAPVVKREGNIGLQVRFDETQLAPNQSRGGVLIVSNQGEKTGVQFELEMEGLDNDCFMIEPAPLLAAGSEAEVAFRFYHRGHKPLAGEHAVTIRATAPGAYPNDVAIATCTLDVQPFFMHTFGPVTGDTPRPELPALVNGVATDQERLIEPIDADEEILDAGWEAIEETVSTVEVIAQPQERPAEAGETSAQICILPDDTRVLTAADAAKELAPDTLVMVVEAVPAEPSPPAEMAVKDVTEPEITEPGTTAGNDWWPEPEAGAGQVDEEPAVIVLKAAPSPEVEVTVEPEPVTGDDDWWSETDATTES